MAKLKKLIALISALLLPLCLSGCIQYVELSERGIVQAVGVDYLPDSKVYRMSLQYFFQSGEGGQNQIDKTQPNVLKSVGEGVSVFDAAEDASVKTGKDLLFSENRLIIIGSELAKYDLEGTLSFFVSNYHSHPRAYVAAAKNTAEEIIDIRFKEGNVSTDKLTNMITNASRRGTSPDCRIYDAMISLSYSSRSAYLPLLEVKEEKTDVTVPPESGSSGGQGGSGSSGGGEEEQKEKTVVISGGAAFSQGKLIGTGTRGDSAGIQLITGNTPELSVSVRTDDDSKAATVTLFKLDIKTIPKISDGKLSFNIDGFGFGRYEERVFLSDGDDKAENELTLKVEQSVVKAMTDALEKIKSQYGCDAFGFEKLLLHSYPDFWYDNRDNISEIIRKAPVEISFHCQPYIEGIAN